MPIYEYECLECGLHFDRLQRFGEPGPETCPRGHKDIHRLLGQPAIIFKYFCKAFICFYSRNSWLRDCWYFCFFMINIDPDPNSGDQDCCDQIRENTFNGVTSFILFSARWFSCPRLSTFLNLRFHF